MRNFSKGADLQSRQIQSPSDADANLMNPAPRFTFKHCKKGSRNNIAKKMWENLATEVGITLGAGETINTMVGAPSADCFTFNNLQLNSF